MAAPAEGPPELREGERAERAEQAADRPEQAADRPEQAADRPAIPADLPRVRQQRGRFLVWAAGAARELRERRRVWGALVGAPPRRGRSAGAAAGAAPGGPRLPLELRREEVEVLRESGGAALESVDEDETEPDETLEGPSRPSPPRARRSRVFRALWGRGCHLTAGGKFGGDFLLYPGPPSQFHAAAVVQCPCSSHPRPLGALLAAARLGTSVRKALLLCSSEPPGGALRCTALQWRADLT